MRTRKMGEDRGPRGHRETWRHGELGKHRESQEPESVKRWAEIRATFGEREKGACREEEGGEGRRKVLWRMGFGGERIPK